MPTMNYADNCYANLVLHRQNKEIYIGKNRILEYRAGRNTIDETKLMSKILVGAGFIDNKTVSIKDISYDFLRSLGFIISTGNPVHKNFAGQRVEYRIRRRNPVIQECSSVPSKHFIQYDAVNKKIRIIGENAERRWISLEPSAQYRQGRKPDMRKAENIIKVADSIMQDWYPFETREETKVLQIPEIIVGVNKRGDLVSIPESNDPIIFGIVGERRCGKCVEENTEIFCNDGEIKKIKDIEIGDVVFGTDKEFKIIKTKVIAKEYVGKKKTFEITLDGGKALQDSDPTIICSKEHRFQTTKGTLPLKDLKIGDLIPVAKITDFLRKGVGTKLRFNKIKKIKDIGFRKCYDIQVEGNGTFMLANGIITHNSLLLHRLMDNIINKWGKKGANLNDVNKETGAYSKIWTKDSPFQKQLDLIGEKSMPLPIYYCHPSLREFKREQMIHPDTCGFMTSLPFKKAMLDYNNFLRGKKDWEFKNTAVYFRGLMFDENGKERSDTTADVDGSRKKNNLLACKNITEMNELIDRSMPGRGLSGSRMKIKGVLKDIWKENIFDISSDVEAYWKIKDEIEEKEYSPWLAGMRCNLFPSIITSNIRDEEFYPQYFRYVAEDIYENQKNDSFFKNQEIYLFIDEFIDLLKNYKIRDVIDRMIREGGMNRVGVAWAGQWNEDIPQSLKLNTTYYFAFKQIDASAKALKKDFSLPDYIVKDMKVLKKFECYAMVKTTNSFILYTKDGERIETDEPQKIKIFPPVSAHSPPKSIVVEQKGVEV